ncbi:hypothetical protein TIFTF001_033471 [Ficus carica]|uniref:Uncharacterized protein n=1 Tax=Ficus carica TaxID=3494 RepID=A0AA88DYJ9_FICCA|nr:hypothetical protein TIFTF001_033471 [Ficus carica]
MSSNSLSGVISEVHFHKLSNLKLGPQFPSWLHNQLNLSVLDITHSGISGAIPHWFSDLTVNLKYLNLSFNHLNTPLPVFPLRSDLFPIVDLSSNQFHGSIPPSLSNASEIYRSNIKFSRFRSFLCEPVNVETRILDFSNNLISGDLPSCWWIWEELYILNLENNKLSGVIPSSIGLSSQIAYLNLRHNKFSGNLPSLGNCTDLQILDVGENNLKGEMPTWIGERLTKLVFLSLMSNRIYGSTPSTICNLQSIKILDFTCNNISGAIPSSILNFISMVQKDDEESLYISIYRL